MYINCVLNTCRCLSAWTGNLLYINLVQNKLHVDAMFQGEKIGNATMMMVHVVLRDMQNVYVEQASV